MRRYMCSDESQRCRPLDGVHIVRMHRSAPLETLWTERASFRPARIRSRYIRKVCIAPAYFHPEAIRCGVAGTLQNAVDALPRRKCCSTQLTMPGSYFLPRLYATKVNDALPGGVPGSSLPVDFVPTPAPTLVTFAVCLPDLRTGRGLAASVPTKKRHAKRGNLPTRHTIPAVHTRVVHEEVRAQGRCCGAYRTLKKKPGSRVVLL